MIWAGLRSDLSPIPVTKAVEIDGTHIQGLPASYGCFQLLSDFVCVSAELQAIPESACDVARVSNSLAKMRCPMLDDSVLAIRHQVV